MANLPKFSGKYTTAGAYERPQTVLDKSGFIYAKTLSDLGQGFNKALQGVFDKRNAEALQARKNEEENYKFQTQQQQQLINQLAKAGINNDSLYKLGFDLISANSKLRLDIKQAQNQEDRTKYMNQQARVMRKLGEYQGLIASIQDSTSTYSSDVIENPSKVGNQGGVATVGTDSNKNYNLGMPALTGTTKNGTSEYYLDKDMNFRIRLTSDQISKQTEKGYIDEDAGLFLSFDPLTVPNIDKEISDMLLGAKITDKNGNISQEYVDINNAKFVTNDQGTMRYAVEATNVAGAMAVTQNARNAMIGSYLQDPQKAQIIYQQIFGNNEKLEIGGGSESSMFTTESERKFVAAFDQYFEALIPQTRIGKAQAITERKATETAKEISELAPQVYTDIFKNPESYFKNKKIGGKDVLKVNVSPGSVPADGSEVYPIIELGYKSGTSTADGEQTVFTNDMIFDLSDPARVRALIDMLPEGASMKKELRKLVGDDPIESVSIETFEQTPPIYKGISL
jgi:uncharacterized protein YpmS